MKLNRFMRRMYEAADSAGTACWLWTGLVRRQERPYGFIGHKRQKLYVHRLSWELSNGPIPEGMYVCHRCDNPRCFNPAHLFIGTHTDNMRDMAAKGRGPSPGTHCRRGHQLTPDNITMNCGKRRCRECDCARRRRRYHERQRTDNPTRVRC